MNTDLIHTELDGRVLRLRLNRFDKKNALTVDMYRGLNAAFARASEDPAVRVLLVEGNETCFCAGNDLGDFLNNPADSMDAPVFQFLGHLAEFKKPLVAAINGAAVGIGTTITLHCDLVFAGDNTRFQMPFVNLGLIPEAGSSFLLPLTCGHVRAAELLMLGEGFDAATAKELGLVNRVCAAAETIPTALATAQRLAEQPPESIRLTKALMKQAHKGRVEQTILDEAAAFMERLKSAEAKEAFTAFFEKRKADFSRF
ncbi:MAG: enoyl-CoA hydratase [Gammaproteobacteria bacterium]|nr:enoyl-CoA hydratase [Gammaproteobacteria bacterium]